VLAHFGVSVCVLLLEIGSSSLVISLFMVLYNIFIFDLEEVVCLGVFVAAVAELLLGELQRLLLVQRELLAHPIIQLDVRVQ